MAHDGASGCGAGEESTDTRKTQRKHRDLQRAATSGAAGAGESPDETESSDVVGTDPSRKKTFSEGHFLEPNTRVPHDARDLTGPRTIRARRPEAELRLNELATLGL